MITAGDRRQTIATQLGEDPTRLQELRTSIVDRLVREGVLVRVHIGRWRATSRLTARDLGLDEKTAKSLLKQVKLGWRLLLPRPILEDLGRLESRGRANIEKRSLDTLLGPFVPASAFRTFREEHQALAVQYLAIRDDIINRLEEIKAEVARAFERAAGDLYPSVAAHAQVDQAAFVADYVRRAMALYPSAEQIRDSFYFDYEVSYVPLSSELLAEETRRAQIVRDQQLRDELSVHLTRRKQEEIDGFLTDVVQQLRKTVYDVVSAALASMRGDRAVSSRTAASLRTLIDRVRMLNVYGDIEVDQRMRDLEAALGVRTHKPSFIPAARLERTLIDLRETCREAVSDAFSVNPLLDRFYAIDLGDALPAPAPEAEQLALGGAPA